MKQENKAILLSYALAPITLLIVALALRVLWGWFAVPTLGGASDLKLWLGVALGIRVAGAMSSTQLSIVHVDIMNLHSGFTRSDSVKVTLMATVGTWFGIGVLVAMAWAIQLII